jgi:hypothetical protein
MATQRQIVDSLSAQLVRIKGKAAWEKVRRTEGFAGKKRITLLRAAIGIPAAPAAPKPSAPASKSPVTKQASESPVLVRSRAGATMTAEQFRALSEQDRHDFLSDRKRPTKITREQFRILSARERAEFCRLGGKLCD